MTSGDASAYTRRLKSSGPNKTVLEISVGTAAVVQLLTVFASLWRCCAVMKISGVN